MKVILLIIVVSCAATVYSFCGNGEPLECSTPWFVGFVSDTLLNYTTTFKPACVNHDYCYRHGFCTYGKDRENCDEEFLEQMQRICRDNNSILSSEYLRCIRNAVLYYSGVRLLGRPYFLTNQNCSICHFQNITLQTTLSMNETQSKLLTIFDPDLYSSLYFSSNETDSTALFQNYLDEGVANGRMASVVFDPKFYLLRYFDLSQAFGINSWENGLLHFLELGQKEGRQGSIIFDPEWYLSNASTTASISEENYQAVYAEYLTNGLPNGGAGSIILDPIYYLQRYEDVALQSRNSTNPYHTAAVHFVVHGVKEGRQGSAQFNAPAYLEANQDLKTSLGNSTELYWLAIVHYFTHGRYEERSTW